MQLTKNFSLDEFHCKDGTSVPTELIPNVQKLANNLQVIRDHIGITLSIDSGYRTQSHNKAVRGKKNSQHLLATAADLVTRKYTPKELYKIILKLIDEKKIMQGGLSCYPSFVHYDVRGNKARW